VFQFCYKSNFFKFGWKYIDLQYQINTIRTYLMVDLIDKFDIVGVRVFFSIHLVKVRRLWLQKSKNSHVSTVHHLVNLCLLNFWKVWSALWSLLLSIICFPSFHSPSLNRNLFIFPMSSLYSLLRIDSILSRALEWTRCCDPFDYIYFVGEKDTFSSIYLVCGTNQHPWHKPINI
jgi:hypothetical protein